MVLRRGAAPELVDWEPHPSQAARGLAAQLFGLAFPPDGLMSDDEELLVEESPYQDDCDLRLLLRPTMGAR